TEPAPPRWSDHSPFASFAAIAGTGLTAVVLHPLRSVVVVAAVVVVLTPWLAGVALARGLREEALAAIDTDVDLYVGCQQFGRPVPVRLTAASGLRDLPGVASVRPRIAGRLELGREQVRAVVIGVPVEGLPRTLSCVEGRLYAGGPRNELVIGRD